MKKRHPAFDLYERLFNEAAKDPGPPTPNPKMMKTEKEMSAKLSLPLDKYQPAKHSTDA
jgi:hypothetical protein